MPVVCLSGHVHWNTLGQENGIAYLTQQSLAETFTIGGRAAAAWAMIELGETVSWQVHGLDPLAVTLTPRSGLDAAPRPHPSDARAGARMTVPLLKVAGLHAAFGSRPAPAASSTAAGRCRSPSAVSHSVRDEHLR